MAPGPFSPEVKRLQREADHSPPSDTEVKNAWGYTSTSPCVFIAWCVVKHWENFTFTLILTAKYLTRTPTGGIDVDHDFKWGNEC
jgi:hypothetical protein